MKEKTEKFISLKQKFLVPSLMILLTLLFIYQIINYNIQKHSLTNNFLTDCNTYNKLISLVILNPLYTYNNKQIKYIIESFINNKNIISIELYDENKNLYSYHFNPQFIKFENKINNNNEFDKIFNKVSNFYILKEAIFTEILNNDINNYLWESYKNKLSKLNYLKLSNELIYNDLKIGRIDIYYNLGIVNEQLKKNIIISITQNFILLMTLYILILTLLNSYISKPIINISKFSKQISEGNLNINIVNNKNDEIGTLIKSLNLFLYELHNDFIIIKKKWEDMKNITNNVNKSSILLTNKTESDINNISEISTSLEKYIQSLNTLDDNNNKQQNLIQSIASTIENYLTEIDKIIKKINDLKNNIEENIQLAKEGKNIITILRNNSDLFTSNIININNIIKYILKENENIDNIINTIYEISEQTNILSLNASIEASHAGEFGKGFAVVASEIRNLSHKTTIAVNDISKYLQNIRKQIENISETANNAGIITENAKKQNFESENIFLKIIENIELTNNAFNSIIQESISQMSSANNLKNSNKELVEFSNSFKQKIQEQINLIDKINNNVKNFNDNIIITKNHILELKNLLEELHKIKNEMDKVFAKYKL